MRITLLIALLFANSYAFTQNVGIGTRDPLYTLHTQGQFVVNEPSQSTSGAPLSNVTMVNGGTTVATDSVFRFFDPGGPSGDYISGLNAQLNVSSRPLGQVAIELFIETLDLGTGDTIKVIQGVSLNDPVGLVITRSNTAGQRFAVAGTGTMAIRFTSNVDGSQGAGFSVIVRRIYRSPFSNANALQAGQLVGNTLAFDPTSGSLFAGLPSFSSTAEQLGLYSVSLGRLNQAWGSAAIAMGESNEVTEQNSVAVGKGNRVNGGNSVAIGLFNNLQSDVSFALGSGNRSTRFKQFMFGDFLHAGAQNSIYLGFQNDTVSVNPRGPDGSWNESEPLLVLGNGYSTIRSNALVIHKDGNTGIGINRPQARLHVRDKVVIEQPGTTGLASFEWRSNNTYRGGFGYDAGAGRFFFFDGESGTNTFFVNNGRFGIQRDATTNALEVNGNASKSSAGDWLANSDARLKKNIVPLRGALQQLLQLQGITYEWNDNQTGITRPDGKHYGFTAQNVQAVFPELVSTDAQGYLQTAYGTYDALMLEAMRELHEKIQTLEKEIQQLKSKHP